MYRPSDLEVNRLHYQEFHAEAARNRLIKQSGLWEERRKNRWIVHLLDAIGVWMARWSCILQSHFSQSLFPGIRKMTTDQNPCLCQPEPCAE